MNFIENWEQWEQKYKPIPNHIDKEGTYFSDGKNNYSFETYGKELEFVLSQDPKYVWTLGEGDYTQYITNGVRFVNRLAYFVCKNPCEEPEAEIEYTYTVFENEEE